MSRCHSGVRNLHPTSSTFTGVLYSLLTVALYIYPIYYNNTLFALFLTMGVHSKAPLLALKGDMGWTSNKTCHHIDIIRLSNKFINMDESRITKRVFNLDYKICKNWSLQRKDILYSGGLNKI